MTKYQIMTTNGLRDLVNHNTWYTPSGNYWKVVDSGILGGQVLYDEKTEKIYGIAFKEITSVNQRFIHKVKDDLLMAEARKKMTLQQAKDILKL